MFGFSLPVWQQVVFWLWGITALGGGVAITAALASSVISYYISDEITKDANLKISKAATTAANAQTKSNETGIELEKERQYRIEFEGRYAWRKIDDKAFSTLVDDLKAKPSKINLSTIANDSESLFYAIQIASALGKAGWITEFSSATFPGELFFKSIVKKASNEETATLTRALRSAGIDVVEGEIPEPQMSMGSTDPTFPTSLLVGSRPPF
jgi:hypothetical protein